LYGEAILTSQIAPNSTVSWEAAVNSIPLFGSFMLKESKLEAGKNADTLISVRPPFV
jgi:hypothetical protein